MRRFHSFTILILTIIAPAAAWPLRADETALYTFLKIPPTPDGVSPVLAYDVNDAGQVAGMAWTSAFGEMIPLGFVWDAANGTRVPVTAFFSSSQIFDVNERGQVVGYLLASGVTYPFLWDETDGDTPLFGPGAFWPLVTRRLALNDHGQVVGTLSDTTLTDAFDRSGFYWDATAGPVALPQFRRATAINNLGQVVGQSSDDATALLMEPDGELVHLGSLPGHAESIAHDANEFGVVVGASYTADGETAVAWIGGEIVPLDPSGQFVRSHASAVNGLGQVVGTGTRPGGSSTGFLWQDGLLWTVDAILDPAAGIHGFSAAHGINNHGDIAGTGQIGSTWGAFVLLAGSAPLPPSPPPPPALPRLDIIDVSVVEGRKGTQSAQFTATLTPASVETVTVRFATADGTATVANKDYVKTSGTLTFSPGQTSRTINVSVKGDRKREPDETFFVDLTNAVNAVIAAGRGTGTIRNDD